MSLADRPRIQLAAQFAATTIVVAPMLARSAKSLASIVATVYREANFGTPRGLERAWTNGYQDGHTDGYLSALEMHARLMHDRMSEEVVLSDLATILRNTDKGRASVRWDGRMQVYEARIGDTGSYALTGHKTADTITAALRAAIRQHHHVTSTLRDGGPDA